MQTNNLLYRLVATSVKLPGRHLSLLAKQQAMPPEPYSPLAPRSPPGKLLAQVSVSLRAQSIAKPNANR